MNKFNRGIIKLKPGWKEEIINAYRKYKLPWKSHVKRLECAIEKGEAVVV